MKQTVAEVRAAKCVEVPDKMPTSCSIFLVDNQEHEGGALANNASNLFVFIGNTSAKLYHKDNNVSLFACKKDLLTDIIGTKRSCDLIDSIPPVSISTVPVSVMIRTVTGSPGLVHNCIAFLSNLFTSVDLPTLGRPTIAAIGLAMSHLSFS